MRTWLLLLAVLATFKPIVQVASTEETASINFVKAITPQNKEFYNILTDNSEIEFQFMTKTNTTTPTKGIKTKTNSTTTTTKAKSSTSKTKTTKLLSTSSKSTALVKAFNLKTVFDMTPTTTSPTTLLAEKSTKKFSKLENSDNELIKINVSLEKTTTTTEDLAQIKYKKEHHHKNHHHQHNHQNQQHDNSQSTTSSSTTTTTTTSASNSIKQSDISSPALSSSSTIETSSSSTSSISSDDDLIEEPATFSNKELIEERVKPDPTVLVEIEKTLLTLFNIKRPPKIDRSKIIIPEHMKKLYEELMNQDVISSNIPRPGILTKSANTVRSFTHQDSKIDHRFPHHHRFRLYFDIKSIPDKEKLKAAELQLARDAIDHTVLKPEHANRTVYQVLVYDITRVGIKGKRDPSYLLLDNKSVRLNSTEILSLDVQPAVQRWLAAPKQNYGLLIEVRTMRSLKPAPHHHVRLRRSLDEPHEKWQHKQPLLYTYTDDGRHQPRSIRDVNSRSKRAERHQHRRGRRIKENQDCRRHSLYVDFTDVGWSDWIVAPPGYDAYYCHGKCPFNLASHLNTTNHAVVQTLVNNLNPAKVPKPCCIPTQLDGMSMLYLNDQNTVVLKNYQDMTVVGCGCR